MVGKGLFNPKMYGELNRLPPATVYAVFSGKKTNKNTLNFPLSM